MSINRGMDKENVVHVYDGVLLGYKKEWNNAICSDMDGPKDCHTEWRKSDKDEYHIVHVWNLKMATNELTYKREIELQI